MNISVVKYIGIFVVMILLQEFVFNNIQIGTLLTPYIYILFILILPFSYPPYMVLISAFLLGLSVDCFSTGMVGIHASACLTMGYARKFVFKAVRPNEDDDGKLAPTFYSMGWRPFLVYTVSLVLLHHTVLFFLEAMKFENFLHTVLRILFSVILSTLLIVLFEFAFFRRPHH